MTFGAQALMNPAAVFGFILEGVKTNLWGLNCPFYCTSPSYGLLGFFALSGWLLGFLSCLALVWIVLGLASGSPVSVVGSTLSRLSPRARVLASYLHASDSIQPRRRS